MQVENKNKEYTDFYVKILETIQEDLHRKKLNTAQIFIILLSLSEAQTKEQLRIEIEKLIKHYPQLEEVLFREKAELKTQSEDILQEIVSNLIKNGRSEEASEISGFAADHSFDEVKAKYPQYFK